MTPAIDPSEIRPVTAKRSARLAMTALRVALGVVGLGGVFVAAFWLFSEKASSTVSAWLGTGAPVASAEPGAGGQDSIRFAKIEDWPEIKDGIPAVALARTAPSAPTPPAAAPAPETSAAPSVELRTAAAAPGDSIVAVSPALSTPEAEAAARPEAPQVSALIPPEAKPASPLAAPTPPAPATATPPLPTAVTAPPLAPAKKADKPAEKKPKPRPERAGSPQHPRPPARPVQAADAGMAVAPKSEPAKPADDDIRVLGIPLPSGRKIKETFEAMGDAMLKPFRP